MAAGGAGSPASRPALASAARRRTTDEWSRALSGPVEAGPAPQRPPIARKASRALVWQMVAQGSSFALNFGLSVALSRLLTPGDFGVVAIAKIALGVANVLQIEGFGQALIQRQEIGREHISATFWASLAGGVVLAVLFVATAGLAATLMHEPLLQPVLQVLALGVLVTAAGTVPTALLQRALDFRRALQAEIAGLVGFGALGVTLALLGWGVWSLAWAMVLQEGIKLCVLWIVAPARPEWGFSLSAFRELAGFGAAMAGGGLLRHGSSQIDNLIVGARLGSAPVGLYSRAYFLAVLPQVSVSRALDPVAFSAFSRLQDDPARARQAYLRLLSGLVGLLLPAIVLLAVTAPELIPTVYGQRWVGVVVPLQILCFGVALRVCIGPADTVMKASGRIDAVLWSQLVQLLSVGTGAAVGSLHGTTGVATGVASAQVPFCAMYAWWVWKSLGVGPRDYWRAVRGPGICALLAGLAAVGLRSLTLAHGLPALGAVGSAVLGGVGVYGLAQMLLPFAETRAAVSEFARHVLHRKAGGPEGTEAAADGEDGAAPGATQR